MNNDMSWSMNWDMQQANRQAGHTRQRQMNVNSDCCNEYNECMVDCIEPLPSGTYTWGEMCAGLCNKPKSSTCFCDPIEYYIAHMSPAQRQAQEQRVAEYTAEYRKRMCGYIPCYMLDNS